MGLDSDIHKIPKHLLESKDPIFEFNKKVIDATSDFAIAYKPNLAFYEVMGSQGFKSLKKTIDMTVHRTRYFFLILGTAEKTAEKNRRKKSSSSKSLKNR